MELYQKVIHPTSGTGFVYMLDRTCYTANHSPDNPWVTIKLDLGGTTKGELNTLLQDGWKVA